MSSLFAKLIQYHSITLENKNEYGLGLRLCISNWENTWKLMFVRWTKTNLTENIFRQVLMSEICSRDYSAAEIL